MGVNVSRNIPKKWSATRPKPSHLHFLMQGPIVWLNKTTREEEGRGILTGNEASSVREHTGHQFDGYSNRRLLVHCVDCCLPDSSH